MPFIVNCIIYLAQFMFGSCINWFCLIFFYSSEKESNEDAADGPNSPSVGADDAPADEDDVTPAEGPEQTNGVTNGVQNNLEDAQTQVSKHHLNW